MKILDEIADELNELLRADELDQTKLKKFFAKLADVPPIKFLFLDFDFYNEERLIQTREQKLKFISEQNFEKGADAREMERECIKYVRFKKYFKLEESFFYPEEYKLIYFHLGNKKNDKVLKEFILSRI